VFHQDERDHEAMTDSDAELMLRVREGDQAAFRKLFTSHAGPLMGFVDRFTRNRAVSEEIVQEVFFKVYRARKKYQVKAKFTTWLYTIATRTCYNELRRGVHKRKVASLDQREAREPPARDASAQEQLEGKRTQERLDHILDGLPENQRTAFLLVRFGGRSYSEAGEILGLTHSAVKSALFRATDAIRRGLLDPQTEGSV
jgi:RNA polymerase sigma-70 factor (ECF subfamily)